MVVFEVRNHMFNPKTLGRGMPPLFQPSVIILGAMAVEVKLLPSKFLYLFLYLACMKKMKSRSLILHYEINNPY